MAIPFLNNITLNNNEIQNVRLHNTGNIPAPSKGHIYFDTDDSIAKYWDGSSWIDIISNTNDYLTGLSFNTTNGVLTATVQNQSDVTVDLDNRYALASDIPATIVQSVTGGTYITNSGTATDVVLDHDATSRADTTSTDAPIYGGTFQAVTSVTTNATGHVTAIDVSTVTIPDSDDTTYTLTTVSGPSNDADIVLTPSSGATDLVTIQGVTNETTISSSGDTITVGLPDDVTIAGEITVAGAGQSSFTGQVTIPQIPIADTDAASKHYVDQAVTGALSYQGSYNASTNTPDLTTSPNSIKKGWTYTVTAEGTFFGEQLRVGDVIIAEIDSPTALADWTTVQDNVDLADGSTIGIGNVNAGAGIDVAYTGGTATVTNTDRGSSQNIFKNVSVPGQSTISADNNNDTLTLSAGSNISITTNAANDTVTISNTYSAPTTSYATTITNTDTINHGLNTRDVIIQLYDVTTHETVYADVERISPTHATITFASIPTNSVRVLVQKIG